MPIPREAFGICLGNPTWRPPGPHELYFEQPGLPGVTLIHRTHDLSEALASGEWVGNCKVASPLWGYE
eukprot:gene23864-biopygen9684